MGSSGLPGWAEGPCAQMLPLLSAAGIRDCVSKCCSLCGTCRPVQRPRVQAPPVQRPRVQVLPPLRDVWVRPEVGDLLRNKLVRLMTHLDTDLKRVAAEFLFVLCSESVPRFIKYTGYGNAAGLLAARGLMAGGRPEGQYSEDEDTDTDEYKEARARINPVTGRVEEKPPNPTEGMTEEQKEHEAVKLVNMFDKLSRCGRGGAEEEVGSTRPASCSRPRGRMHGTDGGGKRPLPYCPPSMGAPL